MENGDIQEASVKQETVDRDTLETCLIASPVQASKLNGLGGPPLLSLEEELIDFDETRIDLGLDFNNDDESSEEEMIKKLKKTKRKMKKTKIQDNKKYKKKPFLTPAIVPKNYMYTSSD